MLFLMKIDVDVSSDEIEDVKQFMKVVEEYASSQGNKLLAKKKSDCYDGEDIRALDQNRNSAI